MPECINCGRHASRRRRGLLLKVFARASFRCDSCSKKFNYYRPFLTVFRRYAHCPLCYNTELAVRSSFDRIDRISHNPLRHLLLGFTIFHCTLCRYQFRDWRKLDPNCHPAKKAASAQ